MEDENKNIEGEENLDDSVSDADQDVSSDDNLQDDVSDGDYIDNGYDGGYGYSNSGSQGSFTQGFNKGFNAMSGNDSLAKGFHRNNDSNEDDKNKKDDGNKDKKDGENNKDKKDNENNKDKKGHQNNQAKNNLNTKGNNKNIKNLPINNKNNNNSNKNNSNENKNSNSGDGLNKKEGENSNPLKKDKDDKDKDKDSTEKQVAGAAKKGLKFLWKVIPLFVKLIIIGAILLLFLLIVLISVFMSMSDDNLAYGSTNCAGSEVVDLSDVADYPQFVITEGLFGDSGVAWKEVGSEAWTKFYSEEEIYADENGFIRSGEYYVSALGPAFGDPGDKFLFTFENGDTAYIIMGDEKADDNGQRDSKKRFHWNSVEDKSKINILELLYNCGTDITDPVGYGFHYNGHYEPVKCDTVLTESYNKAEDLFPSKVVSVRKIDESGDSCNYNGAFQVRTTNIYKDKAAIDRILEIAPGVKNNYGKEFNDENSGLRYECVTYAKMRAVEILDTNNVLSAEQKKKAIDQFQWGNGNGWAWTVPDVQNHALDNFSYDSSCTDFRAGSIIAFAGSGATCSDGSPETGGVYCGHVAIIESVDKEKDEIVVTDACLSSCGPEHWRTNTFTSSSLKSAFGGCRGVTHLLDYRG